MKDIPYTQNLKRNGINELQNRNRLTHLEKELMVTGGRGRNRECGINMYTLLYFKWLANRGSLQATQGTLPMLRP